MRYVVGAVLFLSLMATGFGQTRGGPYSSLGGYGNVLFPGTGHAPNSAALANPNFVGRIGNVGRPILANPFQVGHAQHQRSVIVPYPVFYGGVGGYGYDPSAYAPGYADQPPPVINQGSVPAVVINQSFVPQQVSPQVREYYPDDSGTGQQSGMRLYQTPTHPYADVADAARRQPADDQPTIYLIAFKDHSIVQALGYWMEGATLHYVSAEHSLNQASIDLIDRDLSQRLNVERGLEFNLPAAAK